MQTLDLTADQLVSRLLSISESETVCILDSCGVGHLGSHLLIAGTEPVEQRDLSLDDPTETLQELDRYLTGKHPAIFTLSYDLGAKLLKVPNKNTLLEPDVFVAKFAALIVHDYSTGETRVLGENIESLLTRLTDAQNGRRDGSAAAADVTSDFTKADYLLAIREIQERIRCGDTYQTNLTHQITAALPQELKPQDIFARLLRDHPSPFAAFITRNDSTVISASPERFFAIDHDRRIVTSPIKGTRPRGNDDHEDSELRRELLTSEKDRAENVMIVDLLRNDLGRICEFGSVNVKKLCELEQHPTFFNLVSTIAGQLRDDAKPSDILRAMFPCGSITGAPKISTMQIIADIERSRRGLSMGAIGYYAPPEFGLPHTMDLSVAIRTMVVKDGIATFNVGGGITIDSEPESEWDEALTKATALINALGGNKSLLDGV